MFLISGVHLVYDVIDQISNYITKHDKWSGIYLLEENLVVQGIVPTTSGSMAGTLSTVLPRILDSSG